MNCVSTNVRFFDMVSPTLFRTSRNSQAAVKFSRSVVSRQFSTKEALLHRKLVARPPNVIHDYLSPTPSHLLSVSLSDFLPESCYPPNFKAAKLEPNHFSFIPDNNSRFDSSNVLPQGHHIVYFSPQVPTRELLPDGTDLLQSPGEPFVHRLWAGGSLRFNLERRAQLPLDGRCAVSCEERITEVFSKGVETKSNEKVFVNIERRIGSYSTGGFNKIERRSESVREDFHPSIVEKRTLVFMRQKTEAAAKEDAARPDRVLRGILLLFQL